MNLNLFENREKDNSSFIEKFIQELKNTLTNLSDNKYTNNQNLQENNIDESYDLYEKRKVFLDNKSRHGNDLAWITDEKSACISEHGDGGSYFINELDLPQNAKIR